MGFFGVFSHFCPHSIIPVTRNPEYPWSSWPLRKSRLTKEKTNKKYMDVQKPRIKSYVTLRRGITLSAHPYLVSFSFVHRWSQCGNICPCYRICWCTSPQYDGGVSVVLLELVSHVSCWHSLPHQRLENAHYRHRGSRTSRATRLVVSVKFKMEDPTKS